MDKLIYKDVLFNELECLSISNSFIEVIITKKCGPFILSFKEFEKENILYNCSELKLNTPENKTYTLYGGHRLWLAPETFEITYSSDEIPLEITKGLTQTLIAQSRKKQPFIKSIKIELSKTEVLIQHGILNNTINELACACWTITMLKAGGLAKIPMKNNYADKDRLQASKQINLWGYTDLSSGNIVFEKNEISVYANLSDDHLKIGTPDSTGKLSYLLKDQLFVKGFDANYDSSFDRNSKCEIYCCKDYLELEAISQKYILQSGESAIFSEKWQLL